MKAVGQDLIDELQKALTLMGALAPFVTSRSVMIDNEAHPELIAVFQLTYGHAIKLSGEIIDAVVAGAEKEAGG